MGTFEESFRYTELWFKLPSKKKVEILSDDRVWLTVSSSIEHKYPTKIFFCLFIIVVSGTVVFDFKGRRTALWTFLTYKVQGRTQCVRPKP